MTATPRYGVDLRRAALADAPGVAGLLRDGPPARAMHERLERLLADPSATVLIATDYDGTVIGVIALGWHPTLQDDAPVACITGFVVAEAERRRGIGRMLLKAASHTARLAGCGVLSLDLPEGSDAARRFCEQTGFAASGAAFARVLRKRRPSA